MLTYILLGVAGLIYANCGFKVGLDVGRDLFHKLKKESKLHDVPEAPAIFIGLLAGALWPLLIVTLVTKKKNKVLPEAPKELPPPQNSNSPVDTAEAVIALQGERAKLEQDVSEFGQKIEELKNDPEVEKVLKFPKRL